jgi:hypothetical protein
MPRNCLTSVGLVNALPFLALDSLLSLRLVSRGCRTAVGHEFAEQSRRDCSAVVKQMPEWDAWDEVTRRAPATSSWCARHLLQHIYDMTPSTSATSRSRGDHRRPSAMELPGMPSQDPLDELDFEWGARFPLREAQQQQQGAVDVEWWKRSTWRFEGGDGAHGRWYLGVGAPADQSIPHTVVSFAVVVYSSTGSIFCMAMSFLFLEGRFCDLYWHFSINPEDVTVLQRRRASSATLSGNESIMSSHPQLFGHWFTPATVPGCVPPSSSPPGTTPLSPDPSRMLLSELIPFSLLVSGDDAQGAAKSLEQLFLMCESAAEDPNASMALAAHVEGAYLRPISTLIDAYEGNVFTVREEFAEMVTPKGVWTYPTGSALVEAVDAKKMWTQRRDRLLLLIRRSAKKGLSDMFVNGWIPIGMLVTLGTSRVQPSTHTQ